MDNFMELLPYIMVAVGAVFIISILGIAGWVHNTRMRIKHGYPLERIVTDKGFDVARQIDQLREGEAGVALAFDRDKTAG